MAEVLQYTVEDLVYLSKSSLVKKPNDIPEWILPEVIKADRERHFRQEKEYKKNDDDSKQFERKYAKSRHDDIVLGPPKLSFASSSENGRTVNKSDDALSAGGGTYTPPGSRFRGATTGSRLGTNNGNGVGAWMNVNKHTSRRRANDHEKRETLEKTHKSRTSGSGAAPSAHSLEEFEAWKKMMKGQNVAGGTGPGKKAPLSKMGSGAVSVASTAPNSGVSTPVPSAARPGLVSVDSMFGKWLNGQNASTNATPLNSPPRYGSPALSVDSTAVPGPSAMPASRFSKFFNGLNVPGSATNSKPGTPVVSQPASPRVAPKAAAPPSKGPREQGNEQTEKDAEGFQRILAMLGRQSNSVSNSPLVNNAQLAPAAPANIAPPPGLGGHTLSSEDVMFFRSLMTAESKVPPPPPGFANNAPVYSPYGKAAPIQSPGVYGRNMPDSGMVYAPPGFSNATQSNTSTPFSPPGYAQRQYGYGFPESLNPSWEG
ncbi:hypothetical protein SJAG_04291 [Schizosaccharomyces japonicus yFS275]|uniref:Uncharacterized protein n=1 Tax=Schizosaccharomyces japonicus (strain yFS275 / FY16936) TaxID=402676 RepID=B6K6G0_SCHJY|nr:hypothetical protein SJAG_04291 [Schizosaccharomyces japonicus yFS275]EEB09114.1 hypothetical protein SJAG_04291 [Schizosaccharomyces japonicus yFS275]